MEKIGLTFKAINFHLIRLFKMIGLKVCSIVVVLVAIASSEHVFSQNLFSESLGASVINQQGGLTNSQMIRSRSAEVYFDLLDAYLQRKKAGKLIDEPLVLNLFPDVQLKMIVDQVQRVYSGGTAYIGRIENIRNSEAIIVVSDTLASANIIVPGHLYQLRNVPLGTYVIQEIDQRLFPAELEPLVPLAEDEVTPRATGESAIAGDANPIIDVLVVYTAAARAASGSSAAIENLIDLAVTLSNTGYSNSGVSQRLRLVHTEEVVYDEAEFNWSTTLGRLKRTSDGYMDTVHSLRDLYAADEVVLIVNNTASCGIGYVMQTVSASFSSSAFVVVSRNCATGYYSFAHELGHNMGSAHDRANAGVNGAYSYSYGYQAPDEAFRSIMAYNCPSGCIRVNYWSNPDVFYGGQAIGVLYTAPLAADNRRSLNATGLTVASFRTALTPGLVVDPMVWNYGSVAIGASSTKTFEVTNTGAALLEVSATDITGDTDFNIISGGGSFSLSSGATRQIVVRWSPSSTTVVMATLSLTHNAGGTNPLNISILGKGGSTFPWPIFLPAFLEK